MGPFPAVLNRGPSESRAVRTEVGVLQGPDQDGAQKVSLERGPESKHFPGETF